MAKNKDEKAEAAKVADQAAEDDFVIEPIAFEITLNDFHPNASYWRCGYQFVKDQAVTIAREALSDAQMAQLAEDRYLTFIPVVAE